MEAIQLNLNHLYETGIFDKNEEEEGILSVFSNDIASMIANTTITCFKPDGSLENLNSLPKINWMFQTISYCLTFPSIFEDSLYKSLKIYRFWLTKEDFFSDAQAKNDYARRIFKNMSCVFDYRRDNTFPDVRTNLILALIDDLDFYQSELGVWFEDNTFNTLIRVLVGCADFLTTDDAQKYFTEENQKKLLSRIYHVLFSAFCNSKLKNEIWSLFEKYCKKWSSLLIFLSSWRTFILNIFEKILSSLFNNQPDELSLFHLQQFIHSLDLDIIFANKDLFNELGKTLNNLYNKCIEACNNTKSVYVPLFPAETFFGLFGAFIFKSFESGNLSVPQARILKTLFRIMEYFYIPQDSQWNSLLTAVFHKSITSFNPQIKESVLMHCVHLINNKNKFGLQFINEIFKEIEVFNDVSQITHQKFWLNYSMALTEICEFKTISEMAISLCFENSTNLFSKFNILSIEARYNFPLFKKHYVQLYQSDYLAISTLNLMFSSFLPFISIESSDFLDMLQKMLQTVSDNRSVKMAVFTFIIFIAQLGKYSDVIYDNTFAKSLIELLVTLNEEQPHEKLHSRYMAKLLSGRAIQNKKKINGPTKTFLVSDVALFTFNEKELEVRDSRGRFLWELDPLFEKNNSNENNFENEPSTEEKDNEKDKSIFESQYVSSFEDLSQITEKILQDKRQKEIEGTDHSKKIYLRNQFTEEGATRNKFINFIVESGLYQDLKELEDPSEKVLEEFDSIPPIKQFSIPLIHYSKSGKNVNDEKSELFDRFYSLMNDGRTINLGLISLNFSKATEISEVVSTSLIFNETPFEISNEELAIYAQKGKIVIIVQPFDENRFLIYANSGSANFWSNFLQKRLVSKQQLLMTICLTIFGFIAAVTPSALFATEEERNKFIKEIKAKPISVIDIVKENLFSVE